MNELEKAMTEAREILAFNPPQEFNLHALSKLRAEALSRLVAAIDASGVIQDAARWQWFTDDLESNHGVSRARINASTDATMKGAE